MSTLLAKDRQPDPGSSPSAISPDERFSDRRVPIAQALVASYQYNRETGLSTFRIPRGVSDDEAMKALDIAPPGGDVQDRWRELPERAASAEREIALHAVVEGTEGKKRCEAESILTAKDLVFSDPRDQLLVAALHAKAHGGADVFGGLFSRSSLEGIFVGVRKGQTMVADLLYLNDKQIDHASSGSPVSAHGGAR